MTRARPLHGYPTRWQAVADLRAQGLSTEEIMVYLDITANQVRQLDYYALGKQNKPKGRRTVTVTEKTYQRLHNAAKVRQMTGDQLGEKVLSIVLADHLVGAILDE